MVKKYSELYLDARKALLPKESGNAANIARELLSAASGKTAEAIIADRELYASEAIGEKMENYVQRILADEPLPYVLGEWSFYGMNLKLTRDVLIPRDDTLAVTELAIKRALFLAQDPRILDLCTGSGCIGLAIAKRVKDARVTLGDVSQAALRVAKQNIQEQHLQGRVNCLVVDAKKPASGFLGKFDLIVANPPYVTRAEMERLPDSVRNYEPHLALDGGEDGLDYYRAIAENFSGAIQDGGYLCLEFGMGQENAVAQILMQHGFAIVEFKKDTGDITRAVLAQKQ